MAAKSVEQRVADNLEKGINSLTFSPTMFARFMTANDIKVQMVVYEILISCIAIWARRFENDDYDGDDGLNLCVKAKRISDALLVYK